MYNYNSRTVFSWFASMEIKVLAKLLLISSLALGLSLGDPKKVERNLLHKLEDGDRSDVMVTMGSNDHIIEEFLDSSSSQQSSRCARIKALKAALQEHHTESMIEVKGLLHNFDAAYVPYWINNKVLIKHADGQLVTALSELGAVREVSQEKMAKGIRPKKGDNSSNILAHWGVERINAHLVWDEGYRGQGIVVGIHDTGVRPTHEAIKNNMRGSFNWYDPYNGSLVPYESDTRIGHGTHVAGTAVGSMYGIGVAPKAKWIACLGCYNNSYCRESALYACGQWFFCPTSADGKREDCCMAPDIVNNSWMTDDEKQGLSWYDDILKLWRAVRIIGVFSQGNSGPSCKTALSFGDSPEALGICATNRSEKIARFSSRGPSAYNQIKPDFCAPGVNIYSAWFQSDDLYSTLNGTSMAAPHVSGTIALLLSYNYDLTFDQIKELLQENTYKYIDKDNEACGDVTLSTFPNNVYGHGRIDALASFKAALRKYPSIKNTS